MLSIKEKKIKKKRPSKRKKEQPTKRIEYWVPVYADGNIVGYAAVPLAKK